MNGIKKISGLVFIVVFMGVWFYLASGNSIEHIEDTNGPDNYSLQVITKDNVELMDFGAKGFSATTDNITNRTTYSSKKYSGVTEVDGGTCITSSYTFYVNYFDVSAGNAKLYLTQDDKIVGEFKPNAGPQEITIRNAKGSYFSVRLAGESAKFKLDIS